MDNNPIDDRHIRVFISSTFQDMEKEREQLIKKVFPLLRGIAGARGVVITELDLRWGITQEESENGKVLEICLNEIDNSRPFFIGLLGDRYGWCPTEEELEKNHNIEELHPWVRQAIAEGKSVTEMEFLYGALSPKLFPDKHIDAFFWIKRGDNSTDERLERLKQTVRDNIAYPCSEYVSPEDLGKQVTEAFQKILDERYPPVQLSEIDSFRLDQETYRRVLNRLYIPIEENIKRLNDFLQNNEQIVLTLVGEAGSGKSATISNWLNTQAESTGFQFISCILQASNKGTDINSILDYLNTELLQLLGREPEDSLLGNDENAEERFKQLLSEVTINNKVCIVIDGINILDEQEAKLLNWLPDIPDNCRVVLTTIEQDITYQSAARKGYFIVPITLMNDNQKKSQYIDLFLERYGKSLSIEQKSRLLNSPIIENPKTLHSILVELKNNGNYDELDQAIERYSKIDNKEEIYRLILDNAEKTFGKEFIIKALLSVAVSRNGLYEITLMNITGAAPLYWSQFLYSFGGHLFSHQGLISFIDNQFKFFILSTHSDDWIEYARKSVMISLKCMDERQAYVKEMAYQLWKLRNYKSLNIFISDMSILPSLSLRDNYYLRKYWTDLCHVNLPNWKFRYYFHAKSFFGGDFLTVGRFMYDVDEYQLSSSYCIKEIIKDQFRLLVTSDNEKRNVLFYNIFFSLSVLTDSMIGLSRCKRALFFAKALFVITGKHPNEMQSGYFNSISQAVIAKLHAFLGHKQKALSAIEKTIPDTKDNNTVDELTKESELIVLAHAVDTYLRTEKIDKAKECFYKADKLFEDQIKNWPSVCKEYIRFLLNATAVFEKDISLQKQYLDKALIVEKVAIKAGESIDNYIMALVYTSIASIIAEEEPTKAQEYCDLTLDKYLKNVTTEELLQLPLFSCAIVYSLSGNSEKAKEIYERFHIQNMDFSSWGVSQYETQGVLEVCLGIVESERDIMLGIGHYRSSITLFEKEEVSWQNLYFYALAYDRLGRALLIMEDRDSAYNYFKKALSLYQKYHTEVNDLVAVKRIVDVTNRIVKILLSFDKVEDAVRTMQENVERINMLSLYSSDYYLLRTDTYSTMANVLLRQGDKKTSGKYMQEALDAAKNGNLDKDTIDILDNFLESI